MWALLVLLAAPSTAPSTHLDLLLGIDHRTRLLTDEHSAAFELGRGELGVRGAWGVVDAELRLELVRSAQPDSLFGVDGNALVARARRAWIGGVQPLGSVILDGRAGLIADPWLAAVEPGFDLRDLGPLSAQTSGLLDQGDLGASLGVSAWDRRLWIQAAFTNGEGISETERNDGTDTTVLLYGEPWRGTVFDAPAHVRLAGFWRDGSRGAGAVQNDRLGLAAAARARAGSIGVTWLAANGVAERARRAATDLDAWASATVLDDWLGVLGRYSDTDLDIDAPNAHRRTVLAGLWLQPPLPDTTPAQRLRLYLTWARVTHGPDAAPVAGVPEAVDQHIIFIRLALSRSVALGAAR